MAIIRKVATKMEISRSSLLLKAWRHSAYTRQFIKEVMKLSYTKQNPEPILGLKTCKLFYGENWQACILKSKLKTYLIYLLHIEVIY